MYDELHREPFKPPRPAGLSSLQERPSAYMDENGNQLTKTRQQIEVELMEILRQRQEEWSMASDDNRDEARFRFMNALHAFNSLVLYGKFPDDPPRASQGNEKGNR
jgi:hypothetical protein